MVHIFELTPSAAELSGAPHANGKRDIRNHLPKCCPDRDYNQCNWEAEPLRVPWEYGRYYDTAQSTEYNVNLWNQIYKAIEKRVNADMDEPEDITVYCTAGTSRASLLACLVESRNAWLQSLVEQEVTQETMDTACKYSRIWVPIWEQIPLKPGKLSKSGKPYTLAFRRWTEI